jgi:hypothetical protein
MTSALGNPKYIGSGFFNLITSLTEVCFRMQTMHTISHKENYTRSIVEIYPYM